MVEKINPIPEKESYRGFSTLKLVHEVISGNPSIRSVNLSAYRHISHIHTDNDRFSREIPREFFLSTEQEDLNKQAESYGEGWNVNLNSNVVLTDRSIGHLIIVDLAPKKSKRNLALIKERFSEIIKPSYGGGFFLETGESYHYLGESLINKDEWYKLLGDFLLTSVVKVMPKGTSSVHKVLGDYRYIGHSLKRGYTAMRLTTMGTKTFSPFVVDFI